ncbi:response regulator [Granulosicoccaceae sp. 1_MG-2023]|nr:response regulator [Granulosicoccaceae sp. 1_MG-2023]
MSEEAIIHLVDDDRAASEGLAFMLGSLGLEVRQYQSAEALLAGLDDSLTACIVSDVRMPGMTGLELLDELQRRACPLPVILITGHGDVPMAVRAMRAGAMDFFEKPVNGMALLERINEALRQCRSRQALERDNRALLARVASLTPREQEVARGVLAGKASKLIAHELGISLKTVENHRHNGMEKLGVSNVAGMVRLLLAAGWDAGH